MRSLVSFQYLSFFKNDLLNNIHEVYSLCYIGFTGPEGCQEALRKSVCSETDFFACYSPCPAKIYMLHKHNFHFRSVLSYSIAATSMPENAPATYNQRSRKGRKAWRKNVDVTDINQGLEELRSEIISGYDEYFLLLL